jgi:hypothetical protein
MPVAPDQKNTIVRRDRAEHAYDSDERDHADRSWRPSLAEALASLAGLKTWNLCPCRGPLHALRIYGFMTGAANDASGSPSAAIGWTMILASAVPKTLIKKEPWRLTGLFDLGRLVPHPRASRNAVAAASSASAIRC